MKFWSWTMTMPSGTVFSWRCNRQAMRSVLQLHGLEAFLQLKRKVSAIVISDLNMPEGSGFEFLSQIFHALQAMIRLSYFDMPIIGVARSAKGLYRLGHARESRRRRLLRIPQVAPKKCSWKPLDQRTSGFCLPLGVSTKSGRVAASPGSQERTG